MAKKQPTTDEMIEELVEEEAPEIKVIQPEGIGAEIVEDAGGVQFVFVPGLGVQFLDTDDPDADWLPINVCPPELRNEVAIMVAMNAQLLEDGKL